MIELDSDTLAAINGRRESDARIRASQIFAELGADDEFAIRRLSQRQRLRARAPMTIEFKFDHDRRRRIGLDEAVFCEGKTVARISTIIDASRAEARGLLLTRIDQSKFDALSGRYGPQLDFDPLSRTAIFGSPHSVRRTTPVAVVTAGTSDLSASREASRTLFFAGQPFREYNDIGVAGLWRLLERIEDIRRSPVVIVAAGMDAALVSVIGGLVAGAVIALPTSIGYGVARGGATALNASLASCAPGVTVVNIDNGYGAACAALRITLFSPRPRPLVRRDRAGRVGASHEDG